MPDPLEKSRQALYLLRDALQEDGFEADLTESESNPASLELTIGQDGRGTLFRIVVYGRWPDQFRVLQPELFAADIFTTLDQAFLYGCRTFKLLPSWELEQLVTSWQFILSED